MKTIKMLFSTLFASLLLALVVTSASGQVPDEPMSLPEVRQQLIKLLNLMPEVVPSDSEYQRLVSQAQQQLESLNDEQMGILAKAINRPALSNLTSKLSASAIEARGKRSSKSEVAADDACLLGRVDPETINTLMKVIQGLEAGATAIEYACKQITVIAGVGTNVPFCVAAAASTVAIHAIKVGFEKLIQCNNQTDSTQIDKSVQTLTAAHEDLMSHDTEVKTEFTKLGSDTRTGFSMLGGVVAKETDEIDAQLAVVNKKLDSLDKLLTDFRAENLRLQIELNLVHGPRYNLAKFQIPESAGGHLELVRSIVAETLQDQRKAGLASQEGSPLYRAQQELDAGDQAFGQKGYKDAYTHYRLAYLHLAVIPVLREP